MNRPQRHLDWQSVSCRLQPQRLPVLDGDRGGRWQGANDFDEVNVKAHVYSSSAQFEGFQTTHFVAIEGADRLADLFEHVGGNDQEWYLS